MGRILLRVGLGVSKEGIVSHSFTSSPPPSPYAHLFLSSTLSPSFSSASLSPLPPHTCTHTVTTGWPRIVTHYEFSLEVVEETTNYTDLRCEADSFPPVMTINWTRDGNSVDMVSRYIFGNITNGNNNQVTANGAVTITQVLFEDSAVFTCEAVHPASHPDLPNTSLDVRIRVRSKFAFNSHQQRNSRVHNKL